jgi:hypothetical protein
LARIFLVALALHKSGKNADRALHVYTRTVWGY